MKRLLILLVLVTGFAKSHAQNISTSKLKWSSVSTFTPGTATTTDEATQLVTGSDSIRWTAPDGSFKYKLQVLEVVGAWTNVAVPGSIIYKVDHNGYRGVITIERTDAIKVRMIINTDAEPQVFELTINSIDTL